MAKKMKLVVPVPVYNLPLSSTKSQNSAPVFSTKHSSGFHPSLTAPKASKPRAVSCRLIHQVETSTWSQKANPLQPLLWLLAAEEVSLMFRCCCRV